MKQWKVLMVVENLPVPQDVRVWPEATALAQAGYQVCVICPKGKSESCESYSYSQQVHIYRYTLPQINHLHSLAYLLEYSLAMFLTFLLTLKVWWRHGFDVLHVANPPDLFFLLGLFYHLLGKKCIFDQHDLAPELFQVLFTGQKKRLYRLLLFLERCSYRFADLVLVPNASFKELALKKGYCSEEKVVIVRNGPTGILLPSTSAASTSPFLMRWRYLLAYAGVMGRQDGVENLLYVLHHFISTLRRTDVGLLLIGDGSECKRLKLLARFLAIEPYIHFAGWLDRQEMLERLSQADIGLVPDPVNGLNEYCTLVKTLDYMAVGLPVVAFDLPETRFSAGEAALYATPNNLKEFVAHMQRLMDDPLLRQQMGCVGQRRIVEQLSWEHCQKHLLQAYERLFAGDLSGSEEVGVASPSDEKEPASLAH